MELNKYALVIVLLFSWNISIAQRASEFWDQKKKRLEYLAQQIAALQVYIGYAQKGYSIAKDGLHLVGDIKKGDFNLHSSYFNSLTKINPRITKYARISDIILCHVNILKIYKAAVKRMKENGQFTETEIGYIHSVFTKVLDEAADAISQLIMLITPGEKEANNYQMKDDERLQRIDLLHGDMQGKLTFVHQLSNENYVLSLLRRKEKHEAETSRQLHNIKK